MQPKKIMRMFDRAGRPANFEDAGHARSPSDGDLEGALLPRTHSDPINHELEPGPGLAPSSPGGAHASQTTSSSSSMPHR